jgi:hypothetical protein
MALLLMLVFSQKMGMSLYLHNWLHAVKSHSNKTTPVSGAEIKFACGCINDFTVPLTETDIQEITAPFISINRPVAAPVYTFAAVYKYFHSLRAPPAMAA